MRGASGVAEVVKVEIKNKEGQKGRIFVLVEECVWCYPELEALNVL
jgi:hypothetical protein